MQRRQLLKFRCVCVFQVNLSATKIWFQAFPSASMRVRVTSVSAPPPMGPFASGTRTTKFLYENIRSIRWGFRRHHQLLVLLLLCLFPLVPFLLLFLFLLPLFLSLFFFVSMFSLLYLLELVFVLLVLLLVLLFLLSLLLLVFLFFLVPLVLFLLLLLHQFKTNNLI